MSDADARATAPRCVQGGAGPGARRAPRMYPGPVLSSTYHLGLPGDPTPPDFYGRAGNPTWRALEAAVGELDRGECVVFASGMAAVAAVLRLRPGGAVVLPSDGYYLARALARDELGRTRARGAHRRTVARRRARRCGPRPPGDPVQPRPRRLRHRRARRRRTRRGRAVAVDNTTATPLGQRPLELGADVALAQRHQGARRPRRRRAGARQHPRPRPRRPLRELRTRGGAGAGPDGGLARPPRARHAGPAPGPPGRQRRRARRRAARAPGRRGRAVARATPTTPRTTWPDARCGAGTACSA